MSDDTALREMIDWLADNDPYELRDLAHSMANEIEALKAGGAA